MIGFSKKIFIADNIAEIIDPIFLNPDDFSSDYLFKSFLLFPLQIYFDFSGYIDMALGASIILGIELPINFNKPYLTYSLTEFWRNWHMTLSRWFKDYVYIPLGGNRYGNRNLNLMITFLISGLWHGANWTFVIWGGLNGIYLILNNYTRKLLVFKYFKNIMLVIATFILIDISWIFFRSESFAQAIIIIQKIFEFEGQLYLGSNAFFIYMLFGLFVLFCKDIKD